MLFASRGDAQAVEVFVPLLRGLGLQVQTISPESKARSTTSAVHWQATLSAHSCSAAPDCWAAADSPKQTHCALAPLMRGTIWRNVIEHGAVSALTGPIERGDTQTVQSICRA